MGRHPRTQPIPLRKTTPMLVGTVLCIFLLIAFLTTRKKPAGTPTPSVALRTPGRERFSQEKDDHLPSVKNVGVQRVAVRFTKSWMTLDRYQTQPRRRKKAMNVLYQTATPQLAQGLIQATTQQRPTAYRPTQTFQIQRTLIFQTQPGRWSVNVHISGEEQPLWLDLQTTEEGIRVSDVAL